jgi:hypothetical protein
MVMTRGGSVPPADAGGPKAGYGSPKPRANVVNHQPFTAPSTPAPENDQRIGEAPVSGTVDGQQVGGGWNPADDGGGFWS